MAQTDSSALREAVTLAAIRAHQAALADIATANGGTRNATTPGYDASVAYVEEKLEEAGYQVTVQPFHFLTLRGDRAAGDGAGRRPSRGTMSTRPTS